MGGLQKINVDGDTAGACERLPRSPDSAVSWSDADLANQKQEIHFSASWKKTTLSSFASCSDLNGCDRKNQQQKGTSNKSRKLQKYLLFIYIIHIKEPAQGMFCLFIYLFQI